MQFLKDVLGLAFGSALVALGAATGLLHLTGVVRDPGLIAMLLSAPTALASPVFLWLWAGAFVVGGAVSVIGYLRAR